MSLTNGMEVVEVFRRVCGFYMDPSLVTDFVSYSL